MHHSQTLLQLEPQQDVEVVGRLVGLGADQGGPHVIDGEIPLIFARLLRRLGKRGTGLGRKCFQNARPRPTKFSHIRDWDS